MQLNKLFYDILMYALPFVVILIGGDNLPSDIADSYVTLLAYYLALIFKQPHTIQGIVELFKLGKK